MVDLIQGIPSVAEVLQETYHGLRGGGDARDLSAGRNGVTAESGRRSDAPFPVDMSPPAAVHGPAATL